MENLNFIPMGIRNEKYLKNSNIINLAHRFIEPQKIVWSSNGVKSPQNLLIFKEPQLTNENSSNKNCVISTKENPEGLLLDFGVEFHGYAKLFVLATSQKRLKLRYRFGESVSEAMTDITEDGTATNDHITRDGEISVGILSMEEIGPSGFRFLRIDLLDKNAEISIMAVKGIMTYREIEYKGSFWCDDERLNKIWNTGAYTVHLNMQDYIWDGIKRDRLVWIGDMFCETATIAAVFGCDESVPKSLDLCRNETPLPKMMNTITTYSIWWVMMQYSWYMQNGNFEYLFEQKQYLKELLPILCDMVDENGSENINGWKFLDWPTNGRIEDTHAGLQGLLKSGLDNGAFLMSELNEKEIANLCTRTAQKMKNHVPQNFTNKQAASILALAGIVDIKKIANKILIKNHAHGLSTFLGSFTLEALAKAGFIDEALKMASDYWGGMLDMGATTFWEDFDVDWKENAARIDEIVPIGKKDIHADYGNFCYKGLRHSLCHGWASGVSAFLSNYVMGIRPVKAGCKTVEIKPNMGYLRHIKGTYPTPYGTISVEFIKDKNGNIEKKIDCPKEIEII